MMDYALLAVGILVIGSVSACAYGLFFVRDAVDDLKGNIRSLEVRVGHLPGDLPAFVPPTDLSVLLEAMEGLRGNLRTIGAQIDHLPAPPAAPDLSLLAEIDRRVSLNLALTRAVYQQRAQEEGAPAPVERKSDSPGRALLRSALKRHQGAG